MNKLKLRFICGLILMSPIAAHAQIEFLIKGLELYDGNGYSAHPIMDGDFFMVAVNPIIGPEVEMVKIEVEIKNIGNDTLPIFRVSDINDNFFICYNNLEGKMIKDSITASAINEKTAKYAIAPGESYMFNLVDFRWTPKRSAKWPFDILDSIEVEYHRTYLKNDEKVCDVYVAKVSDWKGIMIREAPEGGKH